MEKSKLVHQLIADIISHTHDNSRLETQLIKFTDWEGLVKLGSEHLMIPSIYWSLKAKKLLHLLPSDLSIYMTTIYEINANRNQSIQNQIEELSKLLNFNNITYAFIKGAAFSQHLGKTATLQRMIGDLDLLIDQKDLHKTQNLLLSEGYQEKHKFNFHQKGFRHLNRLVHNHHIAAVELHKSVLNTKYHSVESKLKLLPNAITINGISVLTKDDLILTSVLSFQINDKGNYYNSFHFKTIYDCLLLGLLENQTVLLTLFNWPITRSFIANAAYFLPELEIQLRGCHLHSHYKKLNRKFKYPQFDRYLLRIKWIYLYISERITNFLTNSSYRQHVLKNKIFPNFN